ncbi:MAG TPA: electron transfer flavoprotein subunit beta, partial [Myxococcota bacterium]|nr:electron transfer flavoprotein subunit beta [Myxococcota bacterium]
MAAKKKPIVEKTVASLGVNVGAAAAVEGAYSLPPARPAGRIIGGDPATAVKELVRLLRDEAKVI